MSEPIERELGKHEAQIVHLQHQMNEVLKELHDINATVSEAKGGWRIALLLCTTGGALGALASKYLLGV